jgi:hypothetical protein
MSRTPMSGESRHFEDLARVAMSRHYGTPMGPCSLPGVRKAFDLVSEDGRIVGDAKYYTLVGGVRLPPAKFSTIAEYVWLLSQTSAEHRFLVFGNDRRVPEEWLKRYGRHTSGIDFFFLERTGELHLLPEDGARPVPSLPREPIPVLNVPAIEGAHARAARNDPGITLSGLAHQSERNMERFEEVWRRIVAHEGDEFRTTTGLPFTYEIAGDILHPSRTKYNIAKSQVAKAFELVPFDGPGIINAIVRGPSYVWAILHDARIRRSRW